MLNSKLKLCGYDLLGDQGEEGIRYAWQYENNKYLLESAAFIEKTKNKVQNISGYTTSVSMGCILKSLGRACRFCRTGKVLPFSNMLSAVDIAKQNVLMVLTDLACSDHLQLKTNKREFAYMGQGEPGYSYAQLRLAIKLTNMVMKKLDQEVFRHIISTSGIIEMIDLYKEDIKNNYFDSRVTMHFSLHATTKRDDIMPINHIYPYKDVLKSLEEIYTLTGEKVCIGIMLLNQFPIPYCEEGYTNNKHMIETILKDINPKTFRISLCEYNNIDVVVQSSGLTTNDYEEILTTVKENGFEAKLFSSFAKKEVAACGLLGGKEPSKNIKSKWENLEIEAEELILEALKELSNI